LTLTTHILVATAVSKPFFDADPALIFTVAVASHYLSDAIPHWDWHLHSVDEDLSENYNHRLIPDKALIFRELARVALDIALGSALVLMLIQPHFTLQELLPICIAIIGGILPDSLQPVFWIWKQKNPFRWVKKFHSFMHSRILLGRHLWKDARYVWAGKISQVVLILISVWFIRV